MQLSRQHVIVLGLVVAIVLGFGASRIASSSHKHVAFTSHYASAAIEATSTHSGLIPHVFFHSLIVYPELAQRDEKRQKMFASNMLTEAQFKTILQQLYDGGYVLIDPHAQYATDGQGIVHEIPVHVPDGKKPLILSVDDLDYYETMQNDGFAEKLVLDHGEIKTLTKSPDGTDVIGYDDVVPIIDAFIREHPDFSYHGARGIIGVTGYDGILGYRTQLQGASGDAERAAVRPIIAALKSEGWLFADHSYSHTLSYMRGNISTSTLAAELLQWRTEVGSLVGDTDIYIGPFGQIFKPTDPRRQEIVDAGYRVLYGVGLDEYEKDDMRYFMADRIDLDNYRLTHDQKKLHTLLGV